MQEEDKKECIENSLVEKKTMNHVVHIVCFIRKSAAHPYFVQKTAQTLKTNEN